MGETPRRKIVNAFGEGSPPWNLSFPDGNLTAAEIIAYFPHWLKSVDVIDRFIMNGAGSRILAAMIMEFRYLPHDKSFTANSVYIMMRDAMTRAGYEKWQVGIHSEFFTKDREWDPSALTVATFRAPHITHPKIGQSLRKNNPAAPILFRDLVRHVRKHPTGNDALDLTRCVLHAIESPEQDWVFPNDYVKLVNLLGEPKPGKTAHWDTEAFNRRSSVLGIAPLISRHSVNIKCTPRKACYLTSDLPFFRSRMPRGRPRGSGGGYKSGRGPKNTSFKFHEKEPKDDFVGSIENTRKSGRLSSKATPELEESDTENEGDIRKSRRLRSKLSFNFREPDMEEEFTQDSSSADKTWEEKDESAFSDEELEMTPMSYFSEFEVDSNDITPTPRTRSRARGLGSVRRTNLDEEDTNIKPTPRTRGRPRGSGSGRYAAKVAMRTIARTMTSVSLPLQKSTSVPQKTFDPEIEEAAQEFVKQKPAIPFLRPLLLSRDRLTIDAYNVAFFAEQGATNLWASALSSSRFSGPRRHPPFRELHRLTDPELNDMSEWAENVRWAKEQHRVYGSVWTEYDYSLETITEHRRQTLWGSEELIHSGRSLAR